MDREIRSAGVAAVDPAADLASLTSQSDAGFRQALDALPVAIYATDAGGRVTYCNPACVELCGCAPVPDSGDVPLAWRLLHPDGRLLSRDAHPAAAAHQSGRMARDCEVIAERPDGSRAWLALHSAPLLDAGRNVIGGVHTLVDITRRKRLEKELRESERRLHTLFDLGPVAVYACDAAGVILEYNRRAAELWGRSPVAGDTDERFCGSFRMIRPDGTVLAHAECPMADVLCGKVPQVQDGEVKIERPDGSVISVIVNIRPLRDENGDITGAVNCFYDITARKHAESELREARCAAEAANSGKDRFLAMLSHELRTPLTPVLLAAAALEGHAGLPPELREHAAMIRRNIGVEAKLIDDLLDVSRAISGKLQLQTEVVDVNAVVLSACETCRPLIVEKRIRLHCDLPPVPAWVRADATRLQQILWNLVSNAAKFTPEDGDIYVSVCHPAAEAGSPCGARGGQLMESEQVRIQVRDTGVGIPADVLPKIFQAFEQGALGIAGRFGGLGLGLAISKALVELHQGTLHAESGGAGTGATFTVAIPAAAPRDEPRAAPVTGDREARSALRVLLVDDHADTALALRVLLSKQGYQVRTAGTAAAALDLAGKEAFDVLVSDIGLPDSTGYELVRAVQARQPMKAIALSGYGMDDDVRRSWDAGFDEHIVKPPSFSRLDQTIRRLTATAQGSGRFAG